MVLLRLTLLSALCLLSVDLSASGSASIWDRFNEIPGAAEVNAVGAESRRLVVPVGSRTVRWDLEAGLAFVRIDGDWTVVDLAKCSVREDGADLEVPRGEKKAGNQRGGRGRWGGPARGRQATRVTSSGDTWTAVH